VAFPHSSSCMFRFTRSASPVHLPAPYEIDDFHLVPGAYQRPVVLGPSHNDEIVLDSDAPGVDTKPRQQGGHRERRIQIVRITV
jgi:hypothetical protein